MTQRRPYLTESNQKKGPNNLSILRNKVLPIISNQDNHITKRLTTGQQTQTLIKSILKVRMRPSWTRVPDKLVCSHSSRSSRRYSRLTSAEEVHIFPQLQESCLRVRSSGRELPLVPQVRIWRSLLLRPSGGKFS